MATITERRNKAGEIISYKVQVCVGRDSQYKQIWRTTTLRKPSGLTPAKERKEIQRQADAWAEAQKSEYNRTHEREDKTKITLSSFIDNHWMPDHVKDGEHTPSSVQFYKHMSDNVIAYFGKSKRLSSITPEDCKRFIKWLRTEARTKPTKATKTKPAQPGRPFSAATVQHSFSTLRNILEYAERMGYVDADPSRRLSPKEKPHRDPKKVDFLSSEDAKRFLRCLEDEPLYWRCMMNILLTCGLRRGEAVGLQWGDFDAKNLTLEVKRNVTLDKDAENKLHIGTPKTKESRTVPVSPRVAALLEEHRREQAAGGKVLPHAYIFSAPGDLYSPIYPTEVTRWQSRFVKKNGLPKVSPHDLRHTAASLAIESGADLKKVQTLLGHRDASTTLAFYVGLTEESQRETVQGIESLLG